MSAWLAMHGYDVVEAGNGEEALQCFYPDAPDLVILDLNMPVMNGWQFRAAQQQLRDARLAAIPVLLVTGSDHAVEHAASLAAAGVVTKPFNPDRLLTAVASVLRP